jgi:hypothetical protein
MRFYDPTAGAVLLDGMDLRHVGVAWLRSQIGLVSQVRYGIPFHPASKHVLLSAAAALSRASGIHSLSTPFLPPRLMMRTGRAGQGIGRNRSEPGGNVLHRGGPERH